MTIQSRVFKENSKSQWLSGHLKQMALDLGVHEKLPTVSQLRRELNVSLTTVDNVLAELEAQNVIYRKHGVGIFVAPQLTRKCVGLVCAPTFFQAGTSPFWQQLMEGTRKWAGANGESFRFYMAMPSNREELPVSDDLIEDVRAGVLHGVLFVGNNQPAVHWLNENGVPVVAFAGWSQRRVAIDYDFLVSLAFERLWAQGCRDIALIVPGEAGAFAKVSTDILLSTQGFTRACEEHAQPMPSDRIWYGCHAFPNTLSLPKTHQEQGYSAILDLCGPERRTAKVPDGMIIVDDMTTRGVLVGLQKLGIQPGRDLKIASHNNIGSAVLHGQEDELILLEIDPSEVVQAMFGFLEQLMGGQTPASDVAWIRPTERHQ